MINNKDLFLSNKIVNINSKTENNNIVIQADDGYFNLKYYKDKNSFLDIKYYVKFIKAVEKIVRNSDEYSNYISYLKNELNMNYCMVLSKITDDSAEIEMHHGPILTLFDYCSIVTDAYLNKGKKISSFIISKKIIDEHYLNNIQVIMLSKTVHELVHSGKIFIHPSQAWGNLNNFLKKYKSGLTKEQIDTINDYIDLSKRYKSTDAGLLETGGQRDWNIEKNKI